MTSENETVAEIRKDVNEYLTSIGPSEYPSETQLEEFANRFETAHIREFAEIRECLKEAVAYFCGNDKAECTEKVYGNLRCETEGQRCTVERWRKALDATRGTEDEGK